MELLISTMRIPFPQLNLRPHGIDDVRKAAKQEKIILKLARYPQGELGYYCIDKLKEKPTKHIIINQSLGPVMRDFVSLHEIGHHFLHVPISSQEWFYCKKESKFRSNKFDCEADNFALIAMIPLPLLMELQAVNFDQINPELLPFCIRRLRIWEMFRI